MSNPSRETKFSGADADRDTFIFPVQLNTSRIGNLTRLTHILATICVTNNTYKTFVQNVCIMQSYTFSYSRTYARFPELATCRPCDVFECNSYVEQAG